MARKFPPHQSSTNKPGPAILLVLLVIATSCSTVTSNVDNLSAPQIDVAGETIIGRWEQPGMANFMSIPYAMAPTGDRRWRPPVPPETRSGVQDHSTFKAACPQRQTNHAWYARVARYFDASETGMGELTKISEDCLHLNVWTRNISADQLKPVMVWIHGGSNIDGYSAEPNYNGQYLANHGVVVVSINYRLGVLGFLAHPALTAESKQSSSGHWGILDQIAALKWIQANIHQFGGDANKITVFGESAGAADIGTLLVSPLAKGLFDQAIIQSGAFQVNSFETLVEGEIMGMQLTDHLNIPASEVQAENMRALDWKTLVNAVPEALGNYYFDVRVDDWLLHEPAAVAFAEGRINPTGLIIGANANESYMYLPDSTSRESLKSGLDQFSPHQSKIAPLLAGLTPRKQLDKIGSSSGYICPSRYIATNHSSAGLHTYMYHFTRVRPGGEDILAYHGAEIPYVFNTADTWLPSDDIDRSLQTDMLRYWTNFAKTGDPNSRDLNHWPRYNRETQAYLNFGDTIQASSHLNYIMCEALDDVLQTKINNYNKAHQ